MDLGFDYVENGFKVGDDWGNFLCGIMEDGKVYWNYIYDMDNKEFVMES